MTNNKLSKEEVKEALEKVYKGELKIQQGPMTIYLPQEVWKDPHKVFIQSKEQ